MILIMFVRKLSPLILKRSRGPFPETAADSIVLLAPGGRSAFRQKAPKSCSPLRREHRLRMASLSQGAVFFQTHGANWGGHP